MAETGVLRPNARVELLNGEITDMSPIRPFHGGVTKYLSRIFNTACRDQFIISVQDPLQLDDYSEPQPDLMLLKPAADFYRNRHPQPDEVFLLVEVSDTSLTRDLTEKLPAYGRAGIIEVWIVDLNEEAIEVYREPHFEGYGRKSVLRAGEFAQPLKFPDVAVEVSALFGR